MSQAVGGAVGASKTDLIVVLGIAARVGSLALLASVYLGLLFKLLVSRLDRRAL